MNDDDRERLAIALLGGAICMILAILATSPLMTGG